LVYRVGYGLDGSGVRIPAGAMDYSVFYNLQTGFRVHIVPLQWIKKFLLNGTAARA
jgi:hypothetical protein